ncbi:MAG: hypothetical protein ACKOUK_11200, partial [Verrucomicrobiota bacterium]
MPRTALLGLLLPAALAVAGPAVPSELRPFFGPPPQHAGRLGGYRSPLLRDDGSRVTSAAEWPARRREILDHWHRVMGPWPERVARPRETRRRKQQEARLHHAGGDLQFHAVLRHAVAILPFRELDARPRDPRRPRPHHAMP